MGLEQIFGLFLTFMLGGGVVAVFEVLFAGDIARKRDRASREEERAEREQEDGIMDMNNLMAIAKRYQEYLLPPYDKMMSADGFGAICLFAGFFSGEIIHIPSLRTIFAPCIEQDIIKRYNGKNALELARQYGYTSQTVKKIARRNQDE